MATKRVSVTGKGFFASKTVDVFPVVSDVITIDAALSTTNAFEILSKAKIHSAPVYDSKNAEWMGFFDVADMVTYVVDSLHKSSGPDSDMPFDMSDLKEMLTWINRNNPDTADTAANLSKRNPFLPLAPGSTLLKLLELLGQKGIHRVPVIDPMEKKIRTIITQTDVVRLLAGNEDSLLALGDATVESSGLGLKKVITVTPKAALMRVFELMVKHNIGTVGIIDKDQGEKLVSTISDSDLRSMHTISNFKLYGVTAMEYVKKVRDESHWPAISVKKNATLRDLFRLMAEKGIHRVYVTDDDEKPIGIVTLRELFEFLLNRVKKVEIDWQ